MFRRILIPLDGSILAESVVPQSLRLLKVTDAEVLLLRALPDIGIPRFDEQAIIAEMEKEAGDYLRRLESDLSEMAVSARTIVRRGDPAEVILSVADDEKADLIAMSTHGRSGVGRWFFGSVAERVQLHARIPLLLVRAEEGPAPDWREVKEGRYGRILVPLDGSPLAEEAIPYALDIAKAFDGKVTVLRAVTIPPLPGLEAAALIQEAMGEAEEYLGSVLPKFEGRAVARVEDGVPSDQILSVADKEDVDIVVMTTHGRSGVSRFLMGSVADRIVRGLWRPVLLIRSRGGDR